MRQTDKIADPSWLDIQDRDKRIAELEAENERLRKRYRWVLANGATAYGELVHALMPWPSEQAINEAIDAAMEGE